MTRMHFSLASLALLAIAAAAPAQYVGGVGFQYNGRGLRIGSYLAPGAYVPVGPGGVIVGPPIYITPPFGVIERRVIIQPFVPGPPAAAPTPDYDLSGIDLDIHTPDKLFPPGAAPAPPPKLANVPDLPKKPPVKPEPPAKPEPAPKPVLDELLVPRPGAADESRRLMELGLRSFRGQEYGLAVFRFRQASEVDPASARAFFLRGQAFLAVGQYGDAVKAIEAGLKRNQDWPTSDFRPRLDLYADAPDDWQEHRRRLDDAVMRQPKNAAFAFLRAYVAWFDGQQAQAAEWFRMARPLTADPRWIDLFLKHAPAPAVAAR